MNKFFLAIIAVIVFTANFALAQVKISMLDVAQGDSFLIQTETENILIDTGDIWAQNLLIEQLEGVERIDYLILTHPHADHIANAAYLIKNKTVAALYDNGANSANKFYLNYLKALNAANIPRYTLRAGDTFYLDDGAYLEIISANRYAKNQNNNSIVCKFVYNDFSMLFTGDIELDAETELFQNDNLQATILKAPHHGSKTSNSLNFINAVNPQFVFISAAFNNKFGHPAISSLENFIFAGIDKANIYCTAFNGSVSVSTDGYTWTVSPDVSCNWFDNYLGYSISQKNIDF